MNGIDVSKLVALVVDDNDFIRAEMKRSLAYLGFRKITEAANGKDAIAIMDNIPPDIIICDINMEPVNGFAFVKHVRALPHPDCDVPVIFLTGDAQKEQVQEAINLSVNAYLLKPVTLDNLKSKLTKLLSEKR
jgi:two-component system chemotaxis response regulator CheY